MPTAEGQTSLQRGVLRDLALFGQPLVVTLLLWSLLHERCTSGSDGAAVAAHAVSGVFLLYSVMGGFTIAVGALPAALLLFLAVNVTPRPEPIQL